MIARFNPPPGWPPTPEGWAPGPGWQPDPSWPAAPADWSWWVEDAALTGTQGSTRDGTGHAPGKQGAQAGQGAAPAGPGPDFVFEPGGFQPSPPAQSVPAAFAPAIATPPAPRRRTGLVVAVVGLVVIGLVAAGIAGYTRSTSAAPTSGTAATSRPTLQPTTASTPSAQSPTGGATPSGRASSPSSPRTSATTAPASARPPAGYTLASVGDQVTLSDVDNQRVTVVLQRLAVDTSCTTPYVEGTLYRADLRLSLEAAASTPFSFSAITMMSAASDRGDVQLGFGGVLCAAQPQLPDEIEPGEAASGSVIIDVPAGATWITFAPDYGFGGDAVAWPLH